MTDFEPPQSVRQLTRAFHPFCRAYAVGAILFEAAIIAYMFQKSGTIKPAVVVIQALIILGSLLVVMNKPIGRMVFVPPAILQIVLSGFLIFIAFLGFVVGGISQSSQTTTWSLVLAGVAAFGTLYLLLGVFILPFGLKQVNRTTE